MTGKVSLVLRYMGWRGLLVAGAQKLRIALARATGRRYLLREVHDFRMLLDARDPGISHTLLLFGTRERDMREMLQAALRPGMTILDIGANIGYYVLQEARLVGRSGHIVAVEPSPSNIQLLRKNVELNGLRNVTVLAGALSDRVGSRELYLSELSNLNTLNPEAASRKYGFRGTVSVATYTVWEAMKGHGAPDLLRMDIEGHEVEVIQGMVEGVARGRMRPMVLFETHRRAYTVEHDMEAALRTLFKLGYRVRMVSSSGPQGTARIDALGYRKLREFPTDFTTRALYEDVSNEHAVDLICRTGGVRTVLLEKGPGVES